MITQEHIDSVLEKYDLDTDFILNTESLDYGDVLDAHQKLISEIGFIFRIAELTVTQEEYETIIYYRKDNTIYILEEGLPDFSSLEEYINWLISMEVLSININKSGTGLKD